MMIKGNIAVQLGAVFMLYMDETLHVKGVLPNSRVILKKDSNPEWGATSVKAQLGSSSLQTARSEQGRLQYPIPYFLHFKLVHDFFELCK